MQNECCTTPRRVRNFPNGLNIILFSPCCTFRDNCYLLSTQSVINQKSYESFQASALFRVCYEASSANFLRTFRDTISVLSSGFKNLKKKNPSSRLGHNSVLNNLLWTQVNSKLVTLMGHTYIVQSGTKAADWTPKEICQNLKGRESNKDRER